MASVNPEYLVRATDTDSNTSSTKSSLMSMSSEGSPQGSKKSRSTEGSPQGSKKSRSPEGYPQGSKKSMSSEGSPQDSKTHGRKGKHTQKSAKKPAAKHTPSRRKPRGTKPRSRSASRAESTAPCDEKLYADMNYIYQFLHNKQIILSPNTNSSKLKPSPAAFEAATPYVNLQAQIEASVLTKMRLNIPVKIDELEAILHILAQEIENAGQQRKPLLQRKLASIYENEHERLDNLKFIRAEINKTSDELKEQTILSSAQLEAISGVNPPRDRKNHNLAAIERQSALLKSIALVFEAQIELTRDDPTVQFTTGDVSKIVAPAPAVSQIHPAVIRQPATQIPTKVENLDTVDEFLKKTISVINRLNEIAMNNLTVPKRSTLESLLDTDKLKRLLFEMIQLLPNEQICARWQLLFIEMSDILDSGLIGDKQPMLNALIDSEFQILLNQFYNEIGEREITQTSVRSEPGNMSLVSLNDDVLEQLVGCNSITAIHGVLKLETGKVKGFNLLDKHLVIKLGNYHVRFEKYDIHKLLAVLEPLRSELTLNEQTGIDQLRKLYPTKTQKMIIIINALLTRGVEAAKRVFRGGF